MGQANEALGALCRKYKPKAESLVRSKELDLPAAELLQEAALLVLQKNDGRITDSYFVKALQFTALRRARAQARRAKETLCDEVFEDLVPYEPQEPVVWPEQAKLLRTRLDDAIAALPEKDRTRIRALVDRVAGDNGRGMRLQEVADKYGVSPSTIKYWVRDASTKLRAIAEQHCSPDDLEDLSLTFCAHLRETCGTEKHPIRAI